MQVLASPPEEARSVEDFLLFILSISCCTLVVGVALLLFVMP
jgi:hypothetical protein